jgi:RNA polymerase-binding transcription factor DksA
METRQRLELELKKTVTRLRKLEGTVVIEYASGVPGDNTPYSDEVDEIQASERREMSYATREFLADRVNRLVAALERLDEGEYGTCVECGEAIAPARLRAMPEVSTCVRCQDRIERLGRQLQPVGAGVETDEE